MNRVCAISGANGYVGSCLKDALMAAGWRVVALSRNPENENADCYKWDLTDQRDLVEELRRRSVDTLLHCAWDFSVRDSRRYELVNLKGTERLFQSAQNAGISNLIFISSISAFNGCRSVYGKVKLAAETLSHACGAYVVRPGLVYGPSGRGVFGSMVKSIRTKRLIPIVGTGRYPQFLIHEADLSKLIAEVCLGKWKAFEGQPIAIAHPRFWLFEDLVKEIARLTNVRAGFVRLPWRLLYATATIAESLRLSIPFRSDSIISLVHQNPEPDFAPLKTMQASVRAFPDGF